MIAVVAIYHSPPGAPKLIAVRKEHLNVELGRPEWKEEPEFFDDIDAARAVVPEGFQREIPTARDRRELPLLIEVWIEKPEGDA